jgi:hypothetical protein
MLYRALALGILVIAACEEPQKKESIVWGRIVRDSVPQEPREYPGNIRPDIGTGCAASLRVSTSDGSSFATWWQVRPDSSGILMVSRSMHGGPWEAPVIADSTDLSRRGCGRPAPAIAADSRSGYVHVAYFVEQKNGAGVFFAHSMDSAATFHWPVPIVFGNNPSRVSIDAEGDRVIVAFEDPNANQPLVGVSLSATMGHLFEFRTQASSPNGRARQPVVRLAGDTVHLWWSEYSANPAVSATRPTYRGGYIQSR